HAESSFSVDGQPITDQQSKVFANQIPLDSIQSLEVVSGGPPAEYGDKTSLVIKVTTKSGLGVSKPTGEIASSYGSFGSVTSGFQLSYGGQKRLVFMPFAAMKWPHFCPPEKSRLLMAASAPSPAVFSFPTADRSGATSSRQTA